ncbi:DNA-binding transcription factor yap1 [Phlyctochytrium bullatum]|nr:DNA-binding transcription factor yap1 [Phlyctochytrium bullatum]
MQFFAGADDLSSSLFEPLGAQQIIFPDLETITQLSSNAASRKRKGGLVPAANAKADSGNPLNNALTADFLAALSQGQAQQQQQQAPLAQAVDSVIAGDAGAHKAIKVSDEGTAHQQHQQQNDHDASQKRKPGRKLAQTVPANKRTAQNRAAQRAFRERKERYLKDLEAKAEELDKLRKAMAEGSLPTTAAAPESGDRDVLMKENKSLKERIAELENENTVLREMTFSFDFSKPLVPTGQQSAFGANEILASLASAAPLGVTTNAASATTSTPATHLLATPSLAASSPASTIFSNAPGGPGTPATAFTSNATASLEALLAQSSGLSAVGAAAAASIAGRTPTSGPATPAAALNKHLTASPDDLFSIFNSPFIGLPDDLSFPLPEWPGGGGPSAAQGVPPTAANLAASQQLARSRAMPHTARQASPVGVAAGSPAPSSVSSALLKSADLDMPVFDMDAFLTNSSPDDADVFGDPLASALAGTSAQSSAASANAAAAAAAAAAQLGGLGSPDFGFAALLNSPPTGLGGASAQPRGLAGTFGSFGLSGFGKTTDEAAVKAAAAATASITAAVSGQPGPQPMEVGCTMLPSAQGPSEHLKQQLLKLKKEMPADLPAACCENQEPDVIDELCEIFKTKAQCSEMRNLQNKILEACNQGDKERVLDLVDVCKEKKRMYLSCGAPIPGAVLAAASNGTQDIETVSEPFAFPLLRACVKGNYGDAIALLPDHHPVFNTTTHDYFPSALIGAVRWKRLGLIDLHLQKGATVIVAALCSAASEAPSLIPRFLALGVDPNEPLHCAAEAARVDGVRLLLDGGAHVDALDGNGCTPLFVACDRENVEVLQLLLDVGADPKHVGKKTGETVLHVASAKRVPFLVERRDKKRGTPLMVAKSLGGEAAVEARRLLIEAGATR